MKRGQFFTEAFNKPGSRNIRLALSLLFIMLAAIVVMSIFQAAKVYLHPDITLWETQVYTILFTGIIAPLAALFVLLMFEGLYEKISEENEERKRAEAALINSEAKFKAIFEGAGAAIFIADTETGNIVECNSNAEVLMGRPRGEIIGMHQSRLHPEGEEEKYMKIFASHSRDGSFKDVEAEVQRKDGMKIPVWINAQLLKIDGRDMLIGLFFDITERKGAEEALRRSERNLEAELDAARRLQQVSTRLIQADDVEALYEQILDTVVAVLHADFASLQMFYPERGTNGELRLLGHRGFNGQAAKFWELVRPASQSPCGVALRTGQQVIVPDVRACDFMAGSDDLETCLQLGIRAVQTTPLVSRSGALLGMFSTHWREPHELTASELRTLDVLARLVADLIDRKQTDDELKTAKAQAELYLDLMGHDINNLHQVALGYLELAKDMPGGEEQAMFLDKPVEVLQRSAKLIQNVRKLQKLHNGVFKTQDVDVCEVLSEVKREFGGIPDKSIKLSLNGFERCHVRANELLHDVFANLIGNAIKHTGDRADIIVDLDVVEENGGRQYCRVMVEDDGPGIPDDFKTTIFNRALKGTARAKGMGLGLYLVKSLVDSYGGRVWVEDRVQGDHTKGSRFVVMLPAIG
jgi:PAS domain S-box-containing protein